ncbi:hypothetical protein KQH60_12210 [Mycetohabitans sp. B8]|uniref:hypothetical protein n=1 Tax=Mycetohabitans sp. B8 TaxID=2841845 RepID=UPI001F2CBC98|nr:hypothetical protein [Mycetohabitans sp. B8]MCG1043259.1 hypothetical protein [Mycetohabitans sp. B8]
MINKKSHNNLNGYQLVSPFHPRIDSAEAMARVPRGHVLGFFKFGDVFKSEDEIQDNDTPPRTHSLPFHVMISTGQGHAAGNKKLYKDGAQGYLGGTRSAHADVELG